MAKNVPKTTANTENNVYNPVSYTHLKQNYKWNNRGKQHYNQFAHGVYNSYLTCVCTAGAESRCFPLLRDVYKRQGYTDCL